MYGNFRHTLLSWVSGGVFDVDTCGKTKGFGSTFDLDVLHVRPFGSGGCRMLRAFSAAQFSRFVDAFGADLVRLGPDPLEFGFLGMGLIDAVGGAECCKAV